MNGLYQDYQQEFADFGEFGKGDILNILQDDTDIFPLEYDNIQEFDPSDNSFEENVMVAADTPPLFYNHTEERKIAESVPKRSPSPPATEKKRRPKKKPSNSSIKVSSANTNSPRRKTGNKRKRQTKNDILLSKDPDTMSNEEKEELRKLKNRESARASRQRRKKYIEDLETTNQTLNTQNSKLWKSNRSLSGQNQQLREVIRIITAQSFMKHYQHVVKPPTDETNIKSETESTEPVYKKRKIDTESVIVDHRNPIIPPPQSSPRDDDSHNIVIPPPPPPTANRANPMGNVNPFNPQFWQFAISQQFNAGQAGKKVMMVFLFVIVLSLFMTIPFGKDDYLLNQYLTTGSPRRTHISENLAHLNRKLLSMEDTDDSDSIISPREEIRNLVDDFGDNLWKIIEEERSRMQEKDGEETIESEILEVNEKGNLEMKIGMDEWTGISKLLEEKGIDDVFLREICQNVMD